MYAIPELRSTDSSIRISPERDVPVTPRVKRIIDTAAFRRLSTISQLGLVAYVYPGATHTRFEHSLGVYFNAIQFVAQLEANPLFRSAINEEDVCCFLLAALLHDIGHWPFCHAIEDLRLPNVPRHEILASRLILQGELAEQIGSDWQLDPKRIIDLLNPDKSAQATQAASILSSMLSGPIDIDKMDYLERDSVHAGVPYGRNFDRHRLIRSLCVHPEKNAIALSEKGKTAIEMMIFARYIMFSEVYWHHAVRSATAMLQNVVWACSNDNPSLSFADQWLEYDEARMKQSILQMSKNQPWESCAQGLFGSHRNLYKRLVEFDSQNGPFWHQKLSRLSAQELRETAGKLASEISKKIGVACCPFDLLIDTPPASLDVQFRMEVLLRNGQFRPLGDISPMVQALATQQFDETVKRVRIFASPFLASKIRESKLSVVDHLANVS
ncbi:MAG: HD domain-containing protein [Pirellula sp.]|nr:HD domain-containing protein [Pirellula sp.]